MNKEILTKEIEQVKHEMKSHIGELSGQLDTKFLVECQERIQMLEGVLKTLR